MSLLWPEKKRTAPPIASETDQGTEVRKMSGYSSITEVAASAPESEDIPITRPAPRGRQSRASSARIPQAPPPPTAEQIAKEKAKAEAMAVVGRDIMAQIAEVPYDAWALVFADPELKLKPEESKKLADAYYLLAQAWNPDFSKPIWLLAAISFHNIALVGKRLKYLNEKKAKAIEEENAAAKEEAVN